MTKPGTNVNRSLSMTPQESKSLEISDRVCWQNDVKDQGEVVARDWSGVQSKWAGNTTYYHHNDMGDVRRLPSTA